MHLHSKTFERAFVSYFIVALSRIKVNNKPAMKVEAADHSSRRLDYRNEEFISISRADMTCASWTSKPFPVIRNQITARRTLALAATIQVRDPQWLDSTLAATKMLEPSNSALKCCQVAAPSNGA